MHRSQARFAGQPELCRRAISVLALALLLTGSSVAGPQGKISLTVLSLERMPQYPPPPPPPNVFVVSAAAGFEIAVITVQVAGSTTFEDYKMSAGASATNAEGAKFTAVLSKPYKAGVSPEIWDKQVLAFTIKKGDKLKTLSVAGMTFDLSEIKEPK